jgi:hypothetical protein
LRNPGYKTRAACGEWGVLQRRDQARFLQEEEVSVFCGSETWIVVELATRACYSQRCIEVVVEAIVVVTTFFAEKTTRTLMIAIDNADKITCF